MPHTTAQNSRTASRSLLLGVLHLIGATLEFLFSKPVLMAGLFVVAVVAQVSLVLTVGRAPADTLMPSTVAVAHHSLAADCVMFCGDPGWTLEL
ncbi:hypothetical protein [Nocardia sp. NPDC003726]